MATTIDFTTAVTGEETPPVAQTVGPFNVLTGTTISFEEGQPTPIRTPIPPPPRTIVETHFVLNYCENKHKLRVGPNLANTTEHDFVFGDELILGHLQDMANTLAELYDEETYQDSDSLSIREDELFIEFQPDKYNYVKSSYAYNRVRTQLHRFITGLFENLPLKNTLIYHYGTTFIPSDFTNARAIYLVQGTKSMVSDATTRYKLKKDAINEVREKFMSNFRTDSVAWVKTIANGGSVVLADELSWGPSNITSPNYTIIQLVNGATIVFYEEAAQVSYGIIESICVEIKNTMESLRINQGSVPITNKDRFLTKILDQRKNTFKKVWASAKEDWTDAQTMCDKTFTHYVEAERLYQLFLGSEKQLFDSLQKDIEKLSQTPMFENVSVNENGVVAVTSQIILKTEDENGIPQRYNFGNMTINYIFQTNKIIVTGDSKVPKCSGYCHPHIFDDGRPCLGNVNSSINVAIANGQLNHIFTTMYWFLASYNVMSPTRALIYFKDNIIKEEKQKEKIV